MNPICETIEHVEGDGWCPEPARYIILEPTPDNWVPGTLICQRHDACLRAQGGSTRPIRFAADAEKGSPMPGGDAR